MHSKMKEPTKWLGPVVGFFLGILGAQLQGCKVKLREDVPKSPQPSLGTECLSDLGAVTSRMMDGKSHAQEIQTTRDCLLVALDRFEEQTQGAESEFYRVSELRNFFHAYFLKDLRLQDAFLVEGMELKKLLLGGRTDGFSKRELKALRTWILRLTPILVEAQSILPLEVERWTREDVETFHSRLKALRSVGAGIQSLLSDLMPLKSATYTFSQAGKFLEAAEGTFGTKDPSNRLSQRFYRSQALFQDLKKTLFVGPSDRIQVSELPRLVSLGVELGTLGLRFKFFSNSSWIWNYAEGRELFLQILDQAFLVLEDLISHHSGILRFQWWNETIDLMEREGYLGDLRPEILKPFVKPLFQRLLGGLQGGPEGRDAQGLTKPALGRLRQFVFQWSEGQRYLEGLFHHVLAPELRDGRLRSLGREVPVDTLARVTLEQALAPTGGAWTPEVERSREDLQQAMSTNFAKLIPNGREVHLVTRGTRHLRSFYHLSEMHWMRSVLRMALVGYLQGSQIQRRAAALAGLTEEEFGVFVKDVWQILVDLKLVHPDRKAQEEASKRFMEANLFSPSSDGNGTISVSEGNEVLMYMISAKALSSRMTEIFRAKCPVGPEDYYGNPTIETFCYRRILWSERNTIFREYPAFRAWMNTLSPSQIETFIKNIETAARIKGYQDRIFWDSADQETFLMMVHYLETMFHRFDRNGDAHFNASDAELAFPIFADTLGKVSGFMKCGRARASEKAIHKTESLFTYLLSRGRPPITDDMTRWQKIKGAADFTAWRLKRHGGSRRWIGWDFTSDRNRVYEVFGTLSKMGSGSEMDEEPEPDTCL